MPPKTSSNEIRLVRVYDAPLKAVWDAWNDPKQAAQWWGPRGITITTHSQDFKPGGVWDYTMHAPDGTHFPNKIKYLELVPFSRMVYDHGGSDLEKPMFRVTVSFTETKGKTRLEMVMAHPSAEAAEESRQVVKKYSGNSTWDRLAEYLETSSTGKENFVIARSFEVARDKMFELWTDPKHLAKWLAPAGTEMAFIKVDIREGGEGFYHMTGPDGSKMYGKTQYLKIQKPELLVYTQQFSDENGKVARHPMSPTWPETMLTTVHFDEEGPSSTRISLTWEPYHSGQQEIDTFRQAKAGMTQGWTGSLDKLEAYLETAAQAA